MPKMADIQNSWGCSHVFQFIAFLVFLITKNIDCTHILLAIDNVSIATMSMDHCFRLTYCSFLPLPLRNNGPQFETCEAKAQRSYCCPSSSSLYPSPVFLCCYLCFCVSLLVLVSPSTVFLCCYSSRGTKVFCLFHPWVADVSALWEEVAIDNSKNNYATKHKVKWSWEDTKWKSGTRRERLGDKSSIMFQTRNKDYELLWSPTTPPHLHT